MIFFLHPIVDAVNTVLTKIRKSNVPKLLVEIVNLIPTIINSFDDLIKMFVHKPTSEELKEVIDKELDQFISLCDTQFDNIESDMPEAVSDEIIGHLAGMTKCFLYHKAKIAGYYVEKIK